jgi:hypothetical protein
MTKSRRPRSSRLTPEEVEGLETAAKASMLAGQRALFAQQQPVPRKVRIQKKPGQALAKQELDSLYPNGVPDHVLTKTLYDQVNDRLSRKGQKRLSLDTISRTAGRQKD